MKIKLLLGLIVFPLSNCQAAQCELNGKEFQLFEAIIDNDIPEIKKLVSQGINVNIHTPNDIVIQKIRNDGVLEMNHIRRNRTPLHYALSYGNFEIIKLLVDAGANINETAGPEENTPLHELISIIFASPQKNNLKIIRYLLERGADPSIKNRRQLNAFTEINNWEEYIEDRITVIENLKLAKQNLDEVRNLVENYEQIKKEYEKNLALTVGQELEKLNLPSEISAIAQSYIAPGDWEKNIKRNTQGPPGGPAMDLSQD